MPNAYTADIKTIFTNALEQGDYSNIKADGSSGGGNCNNNNNDGKLFKLKRHLCVKKGHKATYYLDKDNKGGINE